MIPEEVTLSNFLSYDDNGGDGYRFNFREHRLWSISGVNGAGKSTIFDAITYALFGQHRGGAQHDEELLNKNATNLECSFTFTHNAVQYRVTRTLKKRTSRNGAATYPAACQIDWYDPTNEAWREVPGTNSVRALEDFIGQLLHIDYETFVSSVLLLQGESDKLIRARPSMRFQHLASLLDLSRFRRLEDRAAERARNARDQRDLVNQRLQEHGLPSADEVNAAQQVADDAKGTYDQALTAATTERGRVERVQRFWDQSARHDELFATATTLAEAQENAARIRADAAAKRELDDFLPSLQDACDCLAAGRRADQEADAAAQAAALIDLDAAGATASAADAAVAVADAALDELSTQRRNLSQELRDLRPNLELAQRLRTADGAVESNTGVIARLNERLTELPEVDAQARRLAAIAEGKTLMQSYRDDRLVLHQTLAGRDAADLEAEKAAAEQRLAEADAALQQMRDALAADQRNMGALRGQADGARAVLKERSEAGQEGTCSRCGQPVSAQHIEKEIAACQTEVGRLEGELTQSEQSQAASQERVNSAEAALPSLRRIVSQTEAAVERSHHVAAKLAAADEDGLALLPADCQLALRGSAELLNDAVASFMKELEQRKPVERRRQDLLAAEVERDQTQRSLESQKEQQRTILETITREQAAIVTARASAIETEIADAEARENQLDERRKHCAEQQKTAQAALVSLRERKSDLDVTATARRTTASAQRDTAAKLVARIVPAYLPATRENIDALKARQSELVEADARLALLETAERELAAIRGQLAEAQANMAKIAEVDRVPLEDAEAALAAADQIAGDADRARNEARDRASALATRRKDSLDMQTQVEALDRAHRKWSRLAKLLGRGGLQLAVMKHDLAQIENLANPLLSRISGGNLRLRIEYLLGRGGVEEISFRCVDSSSTDAPLDVAFLSGGQKFRVAVALAAGIGEYAGLGGSMPSQIIDEGFGSLDDTGRVEMLDAIRDMSAHFERIIVVSHTENFRDPSLFPARYELSKEGRRICISKSV